MSENKRVIIISGGSRGLGEALVSRCLQEEYIVATYSKSSTGFIDNMQKRGKGDFYWRSIDASNQEDLIGFVKFIIEKYQRIDGLINNAAMGIDGILSLSNLSKVNQAIDINFKSVICLTQFCCKQMLRQQAGSIVNISSINAIRGHSGVSVYSATKAGIDGLTRSLAREMGPQGVRVNSIAPGYFSSEMVSHLDEKRKQNIIKKTPLGRFADITDIVNGVMFLMSPAASFITGQTLVIDGGISC